MPARVKKPSEAPSANGQEDQLPNLKPDTLLSLTEKIQQNLKRAPSEKTRKAPVVRSQNGPKEESHQRIDLPVRAIEPPTIPKTGNLKSVGKKITQTPTSQSGKKRLRDGQIKVVSNRKSYVNGTKLGTKKDKAPSESFNIEEEILALGGTTDDYELIAEALSDSEIEGNDVGQAKAPQSDLQKDLARLVKELGVENAQAQHQQEEEDEEEFPPSELKSGPTNGDHATLSHNTSALKVENDVTLTRLPMKASSQGSSYVVCFLEKIRLRANSFSFLY